MIMEVTVYDEQAKTRRQKVLLRALGYWLSVACQVPWWAVPAVATSIVTSRLEPQFKLKIVCKVGLVKTFPSSVSLCSFC